MNNISIFKGKKIRTITHNGKIVYNIYDVLKNDLGYKKPHNQLERINKTMEENAAVSPNWGNKEFNSKKGDRTVKQPVTNYEQLIFILDHINSPRMTPF